MNKIFKLCEYGIPITTVEKIKKYSINELLLDPYVYMEGISNEKIIQIINILKSDDFIHDSDDSVFELIEYDFSIYQINNIYENKITMRDIYSGDYKDYGISTQLKRKIEEFVNGKENGNEKDDEFSETQLEKEIKHIIEPFEIISIIKLKNQLIERKEYPIQNFLADLEKLKEKKKIEITYEGVFYRILSLRERIDLIEDDRIRNVMINKLNGKTLSEIGKTYGITRERARQLFERNLQRIGNVKEDKYKTIFIKYRWEADNFMLCFDEDRMTYEYLKDKYGVGTQSVESLLKNDELNAIQIGKLEKYYNIVNVYDEKISKNKTDIIKLILKHEAQNAIPIQECYEKYNSIINRFENNEKLSCPDIRSFEAWVNRLDFCISSNKHCIRYYELNNINEDALNGLYNIIKECDYGEYSTLFFVNNYKEIIEELDINDEYELHNLIRLTCEKYNNEIKMSKMPHFFIGKEIDKKNFYIEVLSEISPISISDAADYFYENYGHKQESATAYINSNLYQYIIGDTIEFSYQKLDDDLIEKIKTRLKDDFCTTRNAKEIFKMIIGDNYKDYFNSYNLELIGYKLKTDYIQKKNIDSLSSYIRFFISNKKIIYSDEIPLNKSVYVYNFLRSLESEYEIIKISDNKYINYRLVLEPVGITKDVLKEYGNRIKKAIEPKEFFTLFSIRNLLGETQLDKEGFDDCFYESLIYQTPRIKKIRLQGYNLFYISNEVKKYELYAKDFLYGVVSKFNKIELVELIDYLKEEYNIEIENDFNLIQLIRDAGMVYSDTFDKVYIDKETYLNEIYGEE